MGNEVMDGRTWNRSDERATANEEEQLMSERSAQEPIRRQQAEEETRRLYELRLEEERQTDEGCQRKEKAGFMEELARRAEEQQQKQDVKVPTLARHADLDDGERTRSPRLSNWKDNTPPKRPRTGRRTSSPAAKHCRRNEGWRGVQPLDGVTRSSSNGEHVCVEGEALASVPYHKTEPSRGVGKEWAKEIYSELSGWTSTVACRLRVQWFHNGKMKEIKGKGGTKKQFVGISREIGGPLFRTHGLSNNLSAGANDVKQVHPAKDDPRKVSVVIERGYMAFWITISEADDPAVLGRLVKELQAFIS